MLTRCEVCAACSDCSQIADEEFEARTEMQRWSNIFLNLRRNFKDVGRAITEQLLLDAEARLRGGSVELGLVMKESVEKYDDLPSVYDSEEGEARWVEECDGLCVFTGVNWTRMVTELL